MKKESIQFIDGNVNSVSASEAFFIVAITFKEAIVLERRVELAFEENYLQALMRLKRDALNNGKKFSYDDELRMPIPQREIDANPK